MKIAHICLSCFYIDNSSYQENELVRHHLAMGHEVVVIASTETYNSKKKISYLKPSWYMGADGAIVKRIAYSPFLPQSIMKKLRMHSRLFELLSEESPDVIMFHGLCGWELLTVCKYSQQNTKVKLYVDSHEDFNNSARSWLSRHILHGIYYKWIIKKAMKTLDKILCISLETMDFVNKMYNVPTDRLEFFPLGGEVFSDKEYNKRRAESRKLLNIAAGDMVFIQTGKINSRKKLKESLSAFSKTKSKHFHFLISGRIGEEVLEEVSPFLQADNRIHYLGWKSPNELKSLLCAADVYVQPGTQSATMQMALCARCAIVLSNAKSHEPYHVENGWLVESQAQLEEAFFKIENNPQTISQMMDKSHQLAKRLLDYKDLSKRVL